MMDTQVVRPVLAGCPRVYRAKARYRVITLLSFIVVGMPAVAGAFYFGTGHLAKNDRAALQLAAFCVVLAVGVLYAAFWSRVAKITLWGDRIEIEGMFRKRTLTCQEILGSRTDYSSEDSGRIIFEGRDHAQTGISRMYEFDEAFYAWIASLVDLDAEERRASEQSVKDNKQFGRRRLDRVHAFRRAKRVARWFAIAAVVLFFWGSMVRVPYVLTIVVLALFPWAAIVVVARSHGLYAFEQNRGDVRPHMLFAYLLPGIALTTRVFLEVNLIDWRGPLYLTLGMACALALAALMASRPLKHPRGMALALFIMALPYGFGATMQGNFLLDRSEPQQFRVRVVSKEKHYPRNSFYYVELAPWGPHTTSDRVGVRWSSVRAGDEVCTKLHAGAFRVPWYTVDSCEKQ